MTLVKFTQVKRGNIPVLKDENLNKPDKKVIDTQLLVLIECIEDSELKERVLCKMILHQKLA